MGRWHALILGMLGFIPLLFWGLVSPAHVNDIGERKVSSKPNEENLLELLEQPQFLIGSQEEWRRWKKAKYKIIVFFAGYCSVCASEMPNLIKDRFAFSQCGYELFGVNVDGTQEDAKKLQKQWNIPFAYFWDSQEKLSDRMGVRKIPFFVILDENYSVLQKASGVTDWRRLKKILVTKKCR